MLPCLDVLADGDEEMIFDVGQSCFQEWIACIFDAISNPRLKMQKLTLSSQNRKGDSKLVVIPVCEGDQTFFYHLSDVQYSWQIQRVLFLALVLVKLTNAADHQFLVGFPKTFQKSDVVRVVVKVSRENLREDFVQHRLSSVWSNFGKSQHQKLWILRHGHFKSFSDLHVGPIWHFDELLEEVDVSPDLLNRWWTVFHCFLDPAIGNFAESHHVRFTALVNLEQKMGLTLRVVPSFEENLIRDFELVACLSANLFEDSIEVHKSFFTTELQMRSI